MPNEIVRTENSSLATPFTSVVASGNGTAVGVVQGDMINNFNGVDLNSILPMLSRMVGPRGGQSYAFDWALLDKERYSIFVVENEKYDCGNFYISKNAVLKYTDDEDYNRFKNLDPVLLNMPCIFASKNPCFKTAPEYYPAFVGYISKITPQRDFIKFSFVDCGSFNQQIINDNLKHFNLLSNKVRNQLDEEHWCIKKGNLWELIKELDIVIR